MNERAVSDRRIVEHDRLYYNRLSNRHSQHSTASFALLNFISGRSSGLFMPSDHGEGRTERCTFGITAFLTVAVLLLVVNEKLPKSDDNESIILGCSRIKTGLEIIVAGQYIVKLMWVTFVGTLK